MLNKWYTEHWKSKNFMKGHNDLNSWDVLCSDALWIFTIAHHDVLVKTSECPRRLSMWPLHIKIGWKKIRHAGLAQQSGFSISFLQSLLRLVMALQYWSECNKCDKTAAPCLWWKLQIIMIGSGGLPLAVSHIFVVLGLVSYVGVAKKVNN